MKNKKTQWATAVQFKTYLDALCVQAVDKAYKDLTHPSGRFAPEFSNPSVSSAINRAAGELKIEHDVTEDGKVVLAIAKNGTDHDGHQGRVITAIGELLHDRLLTSLNPNQYQVMNGKRRLADGREHLASVIMMDYDALSRALDHLKRITKIDQPAAAAL